ncbi:type III PLP-dependent enzyme [Enterobacter cancerogenus]|uniref:type III PLP-dependent enzyme n=1 Tax=Enterobacter cancerogenus TaxID=69218 RepID=UPI00053797D9|nr:type III PLP-dependent enzyme [Enterobacter cancerogenus]KGT86479.1 diaminopimelate decarboxylase [Enterobacter cancerogenus]
MTPKVKETLQLLQQQRAEPFCAYVYDLDALRQHIRYMHDALPSGCELYYAAKANPEAPILHTLYDHVDGFEAASGGELTWLREQVPGKPLIFGGPGKLQSELQHAVQLGVEVLHVESLTELRRIQAIALEQNKTISVLLRINIALEGLTGTRLMMGGKPTPFGLDEQELPAALREIAASPQIQLRGFHFHLMSHQLDVDNHLTLIRMYLDKVQGWCKSWSLEIDLINVGGGIGINYLEPQHHFDWTSFCQRLPDLTQFSQSQGWTLRFECGRYIAAACGYYVMEVLDVKKNLGEWFAIGRGGTHHFRTPAAQSHNHPFSVLMREQNASWINDQRVTLVGQLCTPKDVLARQQVISALAPGDWLVFELAGAYAWNISHQNFLMHSPPEFIWLEH